MSFPYRSNDWHTALMAKRPMMLRLAHASVLLVPRSFQVQLDAAFAALEHVDDVGGRDMIVKAATFSRGEREADFWIFSSKHHIRIIQSINHTYTLLW